MTLYQKITKNKYFKPIAKTLTAVALLVNVGCIDLDSDKTNPNTPTDLIETVEDRCRELEKKYNVEKDGTVFKHPSVYLITEPLKLKCKRDDLAFMDREGMMGYNNYESDFKNREYSEHIYANGDLAYIGMRLFVEDPVGNIVRDIYEYRVEKYMRLADGGWKYVKRISTYTTVGRRPYSKGASNALVDNILGSGMYALIEGIVRTVIENDSLANN